MWGQFIPLCTPVVKKVQGMGSVSCVSTISPGVGLAVGGVGCRWGVVQCRVWCQFICKYRGRAGIGSYMTAASARSALVWGSRSGVSVQGYSFRSQRGRGLWGLKYRVWGHFIREKMEFISTINPGVGIAVSGMGCWVWGLKYRST